MTRAHVAVCAAAAAMGCQLPAATTSRGSALTIDEDVVVFGLDERDEPILGFPVADRRQAHLPTTYALQLGGAPVDVPPVVSAAYHVDSGQLAWVSEHGELFVRGPAEPPGAALAEAVQPGIAFDPTGRLLVFAAGDPPEIDVFVVDPTAVSRAVVAEPGPQYLPAFDESPDAVLFVSASPEGPRLLRTSLVDGVDEEILASSAEVSLPDGVSAPIASGGLVAWFDGVGVTAVDRATSRVVRVPGARGVVRRADGRLAAVDPDGQLRQMGPR